MKFEISSEGSVFQTQTRYYSYSRFKARPWAFLHSWTYLEKAMDPVWAVQGNEVWGSAIAKRVTSAAT